MWILHFLPDAVIVWFCNILLLTGVVLATAGLFAQRIPVIWRYQLPFKIAGIVLLSLGVYFRGGYSVEMAWRERVEEVRAQLEQAKQGSAKVNTVVEQQIVYRDRVIKQQGETLIQRVETVATDCRVPQEAIDVHNDAARMNQIIEQQRKAQK